MSLRSAHRGETLLQAAVARTLVAHLETPRSARTEGLTPREQLEVLALMAAGAANKKIAERLAIAERTVKAHATSIFNRLGVDSRTEAVAVALRRGLLPPRTLDSSAGLATVLVDLQQAALAGLSVST